MSWVYRLQGRWFTGWTGWPGDLIVQETLLAEIAAASGRVFSHLRR